MQSLYVIDVQIRDIMEDIFRIAEEREGEIPEEMNALLTALKMEKVKKIGNIARYIKNLEAEGEMVKTEAKRLTERASSISKKHDGLKAFLSMYLNGEKFKDESISISWRASQSVEIIDYGKIPAAFMKEVITVTPDKVEIKKALNSGVLVNGAEIKYNNNIQIK